MIVKLLGQSLNEKEPPEEAIPQWRTGLLVAWMWEQIDRCVFEKVKGQHARLYGMMEEWQKRNCQVQSLGGIKSKWALSCKR